ncbi:UDP-glucose-hexose-1-phosphate uridylyltransferase [Capsaspora owczarzaki ATCC 30864]|uniref:Galactose-1-phosphate uridylyltransferase n=1 Tax=Capsaspora owczarzaki (strain ATCC 30864) TaxID=595528 RepID=A0A0D2VYA5_CAPO3|nr:UDP-glucose-hexose-1-phosphate uridylyltransferase [Capsaspora owczarzaki ATCC 30864]KJE96682.1 UDP-glucose-hexose-1-phosphate uridylyltransferase [Capsaspora owczarzaki ATCC 30864]|eukprot:XP_004343687.2 UDP-glucose-hexose-1-phosphate uridylyltransferase [Capsaspora owczarzaki ATCC 30864]
MSESSSFSLTDHPHRRLNLLNGKWILCSPHRAKRPWQGQQEKTSGSTRPEYDPNCYLCPGNKRVTGELNDKYEHTFAFRNDFSALLSDTPAGSVSEGDGLLVAQSTRGRCHVMCFSPKHNLTMAQMSTEEITGVVHEWMRQQKELSAEYEYTQLFENKGEVMGCSNPHPHGQVWASDTVPEEVSQEVASFRLHRADKHSCLLCDYLALELSKQERIVLENDSFVVLVPWWAYWPFETLVLPRTHTSSIAQLDEKQQVDLAAILQKLTCKYDNVFECSFPYSMGIHSSPNSMLASGEYHMHMHFYPPLLRSASVKKFLVGYEMVADICRDITAEQAAERLRSLPTVHYTVSSSS